MRAECRAKGNCGECWLGVGRFCDKNLFALVEPRLDGFELTQAEV